MVNTITSNYSHTEESEWGEVEEVEVTHINRWQQENENTETKWGNHMSQDALHFIRL